LTGSKNLQARPDPRPGLGEGVDGCDVDGGDKEVDAVHPARREEHDALPGQREQDEGIEPGALAHVDDPSAERHLEEEVNELDIDRFRLGAEGVAVNADGDVGDASPDHERDGGEGGVLERAEGGEVGCHDHQRKSQVGPPAGFDDRAVGGVGVH